MHQMAVEILTTLKFTPKRRNKYVEKEQKETAILMKQDGLLDEEVSTRKRKKRSRNKHCPSWMHQLAAESQDNPNFYPSGTSLVRKFLLKASAGCTPLMHG